MRRGGAIWRKNGRNDGATGHKAGKERSRAILAKGPAGSEVIAADISFDGVEIADQSHARLGSRCGAGDPDQVATGIGLTFG